MESVEVKQDCQMGALPEPDGFTENMCYFQEFEQLNRLLCGEEQCNVKEMNKNDDEDSDNDDNDLGQDDQRQAVYKVENK